ncbi:ISL3 family transposase [Citricoccus muralis]|uniref:ISL3 family transposase n=1 Tax=Citricoccus muralis TaxID=169134 RepID=A0ABY8H7P3_9MICC|nr:ISL3 family transposase [Citricoccus muralis]WFP16946.1 ISL3 family transposase [Citricoccus muralis]WFP17346.1 ISL3 family transposase [Citricoccus muralis]
MSQHKFSTPDLTKFCRLNELGLEATGQHLTRGRAVLECRRVDPDPWCQQCGAEAISRGTISRRLAHEPFGHRPTTLLVRVRRWQCLHCGHQWREDLSQAAIPRSKLSHRGTRWALEAIVIDHLSISRAAAGLGVSWHTANNAILAEGKRLLIDDPARFQDVSTIGVDEHVWRHTRYGDKYVTVIIDLTPIRSGTGPARLLDMIEGRSKQVFKSWLAGRPEAWRKRVEAIAMDGFSGFKTAAAEEVPHASAVMDPFHVVQLAGHALDECRRRVQRVIMGRRGRSGDPLYGVRRVLHTGEVLLTEKQRDRLDAVFADERHVQVEATWGVYQRMIAAYRHPEPGQRGELMKKLIADISAGVPAPLTEIRKLGRTLKRRAVDVLAYFDRPGTSNGPTEAINGRLEHLRGTALGFRNLRNYIARSLLEAGGFRPLLPP